MTDVLELREHLTMLRPPVAGNRVVVSRMRGGESLIGAAAASVKIVLEGEEVYRVDGRTVRLRPGEYLYLDAGAPCVGSNRVDTIGVCLLLPSLSGSGEGAEGHLLGRWVPFSTRTNAFGRQLEQAAARLVAQSDGRQQLADDLVTLCEQNIGAAVASGASAIAALDATKLSTRRELLQRLERTRGYLHDHRHRSVSLAQLSGVAGLSSFHLARYFRAAYGEAPIAYHRRLRLGLARELLARGDVGLQDAAAATGYADAVSLSHALRRNAQRQNASVPVE